MGRWRLRKANRHNPKGIKGESETSNETYYHAHNEVVPKTYTI